MSITHLNSQAEPLPVDPASLEGLEPLLDKVFSAEPKPLLRAIDCSAATDNFAPPRAKELFSSDAEIMSWGAPQTQPEHSEFVINELKATIDLLRAQLEFATTQMRSSQDRVRWLEAQLAAKEDQVALLPDLLLRAGELTVAQREMATLKDEAEQLRAETLELKMQSQDLRNSFEEVLRELAESNRPWWRKLIDLI
ncbi:MAG TPA: hypothetical protein V6D17_06915 [Candidatus Obscuribacterales bacterium]